MDRGLARAAGRSRLGLRRATFEDVPTVLRLIRASIERGCRDHYGPEQRRAVFLAYAQSQFVDVLGSFDTLLAERDGEVVGFAQVDPEEERLRALFVAPDVQRRGLGQALLEATMKVARARGLGRLEGAMSLNAIAFYERAGFRRSGGTRELVMGDVRVPVVMMVKRLDGPARP